MFGVCYCFVRKYLLGISLIRFSRINLITLHNLQRMQKVLTTRSAFDLSFQCTRWRRCFRGGEGRGEAGGRHFFLYSTSTNIETAILSRHINVAVYYHSHCPFLFVTPSFSGIGSVYRVKSAHAGQQVRRSGCWIKTKGGLQVISCNDYQGINGKGECHWCRCLFSSKVFDDLSNRLVPRLWAWVSLSCLTCISCVQEERFYRTMSLSQ